MFEFFSKLNSIRVSCLALEPPMFGADLKVVMTRENERKLVTVTREIGNESKVITGTRELVGEQMVLVGTLLFLLLKENVNENFFAIYRQWFLMVLLVFVISRGLVLKITTKKRIYILE